MSGARLSDEELMPVLFPTIVAATLHNERNKEVIERELSLQMIHSYITTAPTPSPLEHFPALLWRDAAVFFAPPAAA